MKNKIFGGMAVLIITAVAMFNMNIGSKSSKLSDISLANVEALAEENVSGIIECLNTGELYCYLTNKSAYDLIIIKQN